jgi:phage gp45-like
MALQGLEFGHVLKSIKKTLLSVAGVLGVGSDEPEKFESEDWSHFGFRSRPHPKDSSGSCEVIFSRDQYVTICTKDRRYKISLADGEVALFTGKDGKVKCRHVLKPDGSVVIQAKNFGVMLTETDGDGGKATISAEKGVMMSSKAKGTTAFVTVKEDGSVQAVSAAGSHLTIDSSGKATLGAGTATITLEGAKATVAASEIALVGGVAVGVSPVKLPVATVGCMAGPFPIANGSMELMAQYP